MTYVDHALIRGRTIGHAYLRVHRDDWDLADWQALYRDTQMAPCGRSRVKKWTRRGIAEVIRPHIDKLVKEQISEVTR